MTEETSYIWEPPAELVAASNLTAFLRADRPRRLRRACRARRSRSGLADGRSLQVLRRPVLSPLRADAGCLARRAMGAMVRRRHHQYRAELHRQAPRYAGVGPDLSGLGGRRYQRAAPTDLSRTRPRGRTPRACVARPRYRPRRRGRDLHAESAGNLCRVFRDPQAWRHRDAAVFGVWPEPDPISVEPWRRQGGNNSQRHLAPRCASAAEIRARCGAGFLAVRATGDRDRPRRPCDRDADARRARPLVARSDFGSGRNPCDGGDARGGSGNSALYLGHDRRAEGLRVDAYRLHRLDGHPRHHHLRRFQIVRPVLLPQRHGMDGRRDVRLHPELRRRQSA